MIKSVIENKEVKKELPFPKLMITKKGKVVLFYRKDHGAIVCYKAPHDSDEEIGYISDKWIMSSFKDFHGSITLSNEE